MKGWAGNPVQGKLFIYKHLPGDFCAHSVQSNVGSENQFRTGSTFKVCREALKQTCLGVSLIKKEQCASVLEVCEERVLNLLGNKTNGKPDVWLLQTALKSLNNFVKLGKGVWENINKIHTVFPLSRVSFPVSGASRKLLYEIVTKDVKWKWEFCKPQKSPFR